MSEQSTDASGSTASRFVLPDQLDVPLSTPTPTPTLRAEGVTFSFGSEHVLRDADLSVEPGERIALVGPSGSGKSTLLHLLAGVIVPDSGSVDLGEVRLSDLDADARADVRLQSFGFVFQFAELLPELSLRENAELPGRLLGRPQREVRRSVEAVLEALGIAELADRSPARVSGGQRQRAAIARALAHGPSVLFADEPTGALDTSAGERALAAMLAAAEATGCSVVAVTHDLDVANRLDRTVRIEDGRIRA